MIKFLSLKDRLNAWLCAWVYMANSIVVILTFALINPSWPFKFMASVTKKQIKKENV